jgi:hypothetical protein
MTQLRQTVKTFRRRSTQNDRDRQKRGARRRFERPARSPPAKTPDRFAASSSFKRLLSLKNKRRRDDANKRRPTNAPRRNGFFVAAFGEPELEKTTKTGERAKRRTKTRRLLSARFFTVYFCIGFSCRNIYYFFNG